MAFHLHPLNDERAHDFARDCWCEPRVEWADAETGAPYANGPLVIHNAADCRELAETDGHPMAPDKLWKVEET